MNKNILVIDDNPDIRFLICKILKEKNFDVRSAANYDQAVLEINKRLPDLAIIDIKLDRTDKDGIDLLKLVNKKSKLTPVIMISGHATVQVAVESIRLGAYEFIEKGTSFSSDKLINYVNRALESFELKKEKDKNQPTKIKTSGSTFKNPLEKTNKKVWELIKESVPADLRFGDACISEKHSNFFVNRGNATFNDMKKLINYVEKSVFKKTGINIEKEIKILEN